MSLSDKQKAVIESLRKEGHVVVIWSPYELIGLTSEERSLLEGWVIERGNTAIKEMKKDGDERI